MTTAPASPIGQELASPGSLRAAMMDTCNGESTLHFSESAVLGDKIVILTLATGFGVCCVTVQRFCTVNSSSHSQVK